MKNDDDLLDPESFWSGGEEEEPTEEVPAIPKIPPEPPGIQTPISSEPAGEAFRLAKKASIAGGGHTSETPTEMHKVSPAKESMPAERPQIKRSSAGAIPPASARRSGIRPLAYLLVIGAVVAGIVILGQGERNRPQETPRVSVEKGGTAGLGHVKNVQKTSRGNTKTTRAAVPGRKIGSCEVESDPPGALVYVDGKKRGVTPTVVRGIELGRPVEIRLELEGYKTWTDNITFTEDVPNRSIKAGLLPESKCPSGTGWIHITSDPPGAVIEIDGKRFPGATPKVIGGLCAMRQYSVTLRYPGRLPWKKEGVVVYSNSVTNLHAEIPE